MSQSQEYLRMNDLKIVLWTLLSTILISACAPSRSSHPSLDMDKMMIRIAELNIDSTYLDEYLAILKEEAATSMKVESGVITIFPMYQKDNPTQIHILEIYADKEAYESHLTSPHFLTYKTATENMVQSLKLVDMDAIDQESMPDIFSKIMN